MAKKNDSLWKGTLEDQFKHFLRLMHPDADKHFDLSRPITFLDSELEKIFLEKGKKFDAQSVDKLAMVHTHDGKEEWVLVHCEVQHEYKSNFPKRMFQYFISIFDHYDRSITAYAILTDSVNKTRVNFFEVGYLGTKLKYEYNVYKISEQDDATLRASNNPFSFVVLAAKAASIGKGIKSQKERDSQLYKFKIQLVRELKEKNFEDKEVSQIMNFIYQYVKFESSEINSNFDKEILAILGRRELMGIEQQLLEQAKEEGIRKGIKKGEKLGIQKGKAEGEREKEIAIAKQFKEMGLPLEDISKGTGLSVEEIEKL